MNIGESNEWKVPNINIDEVCRTTRITKSEYNSLLINSNYHKLTYDREVQWWNNLTHKKELFTIDDKYFKIEYKKVN